MMVLMLNSFQSVIKQWSNFSVCRLFRACLSDVRGLVLALSLWDSDNDCSRCVLRPPHPTQCTGMGVDYPIYPFTRYWTHFLDNRYKVMVYGNLTRRT